MGGQQISQARQSRVFGPARLIHRYLRGQQRTPGRHLQRGEAAEAEPIGGEQRVLRPQQRAGQRGGRVARLPDAGQCQGQVSIRPRRIQP
jgi:hypothetical protein